MSETISVGRIIQVQFEVEPDKYEKWRPAIVVEVLDEVQGIITVVLFLTEEDEEAYRSLELGQCVVRREAVHPGDGYNQWRWPIRT